jgi:DNA-directed RNA polymerase specialized sigma24 family protein
MTRKRPSTLTASTTLGFPECGHYNGAGRKVAAWRTQAWRLWILSSTPPKPEPEDINQEQFDRLIVWLDSDREKAGAKYEWIRKRLMKIFVCRGSTIPEELADKTVNRVARKLPEIQAGYTGDPAHYFVGVAANIMRESVRKEKLPAVGMPEPAPPDEDVELAQSCLEQCVEKLAPAERDLVLQYYQQEGQAKINNRKKLAERLGLGLNALRIRACRIRLALQDCVERCRSEALRS